MVVGFRTALVIRALSICLLPVALVAAEIALAQEPGEASAADSAFEEGRWADAINEYRALLSDDRLNGVYWLRIAQAQR